jgi:protein TonB
MLNPMQIHPSIHRQRVIVVASVLLLHALALWALQTGLLQRVWVLAEEIVVPVEFITPLVPPEIKPPPVIPKPPQSVKTPVAASTPTSAPPVAPAPAPMPLAIADPTPSANAPVGVAHAPVAVAPVVTAPSPPAPAPAPKVELPTIEAEYLVRPNREYPRRCQRRGEQGKVVVRVLIGVDGNADKAEIATSSGYECLNREALDTAKSAKYKPVMRAGVPVEAWRETTYVYVVPE